MIIKVMSIKSCLLDWQITTQRNKFDQRRIEILKLLESCEGNLRILS